MIAGRLTCETQSLRDHLIENTRRCMSTLNVNNCETQKKFLLNKKGTKKKVENLQQKEKQKMKKKKKPKPASQ